MAVMGRLYGALNMRAEQLATRMESHATSTAPFVPPSGVAKTWTTKADAMDDTVTTAHQRTQGLATKIMARTRRFPNSHSDGPTASASLESFVAKEGRHMQRLAVSILRNRYFDLVMGGVICVNSLAIGVEMSLALEGKDTSLFIALEHIFLLVYMFELFLWFFSKGWACLRLPWVRMDALFVLIGILSTWILAPLSRRGEARQFTLLRIVRLVRLARAVRLLYKFRQLWILVQGVLSSLSTIMYVIIMVNVILYVLACVGLEIITNNDLAETDPVFKAIVDARFYNLPQTMLTFAQFMAMDSTASFYAPLVEREPWLCIFFVAVMLATNVALMNLITAVVVEGALEAAKQNKEVKLTAELERKAKMVVELHDICRTLDTAHSGHVAAQDIRSASLAPPGCDAYEAYTRLCRILGASDVSGVLAHLSIAEDGQIEIDTLCQEVYELVVLPRSTPVTYIHVEKDCAEIRRRLTHVERKLAKLCDLVGGLDRVREAAPGLGPEAAAPQKDRRREKSCLIGRRACSTLFGAAEERPRGVPVTTPTEVSEEPSAKWSSQGTVATIASGVGDSLGPVQDEARAEACRAPAAAA